MEDIPVDNPTVLGPLSFSEVVYAGPDLDYGGSPALAQYRVFQNPSPQYKTRRVNLSAFAEFDARVAWPFTNDAAPLNGLARVPDGQGPFPLAVFAHGNHDPLENSTPGYLYLCELLASHGIIAATIDVNFLNGLNRGENDGRAIVFLEHIRQFAIWNNRPGHPLHGKIDLSRLMIVGHSRGGEAAGHASLFNRLSEVQPDVGSPWIPLDGSAGLGPYDFPLRAVVGIAPTDAQYVPVTGLTRVSDNYLLLHGSRDGDVFNFPGYLTYDRSHPVDLANPTQAPDGYKSLLWVHKANHNFFNSTWDQESPAPTLTRSEQEQITKAYIGAMGLTELLGRTEYLELLRDHQFGRTRTWLPPNVALASQYQDRHRLMIQHFQEPGANFGVSPPVEGRVTVFGANAEKLQFNLGARSHLFQDTVGLRLQWQGAREEYTVEINPATVPASEFQYIAFRMGQSFEPQNEPSQVQNFTLEFDDGTNTVSVDATSLVPLIYPDTYPEAGTEPRTVMQTVRLSLHHLQNAGLNPSMLRRVTLRFDRTPSGTVYLDDLQVTD